MNRSGTTRVQCTVTQGQVQEHERWSSYSDDFLNKITFVWYIELRTYRYLWQSWLTFSLCVFIVDYSERKKLVHLRQFDRIGPSDIKRVQAF